MDSVAEPVRAILADVKANGDAALKKYTQDFDGVEISTVEVGAEALEEGFLPPTILLEEPDPACDLNYVPNQALAVQADLVLSNSLGFGGHDACIAFRKVK